VLVRSLEEALDLANRFAPEHLSIPDETLLPRVKHAGSVFVGPFSPEAAGDYASGPNHVLPTGGAARQRGGLSVNDYLKVISVQELSRACLERLAPAITTLARAEGLEAHARSVETRISALLRKPQAAYQPVAEVDFQSKPSISTLRVKDFCASRRLKRTSATGSL
jgi:histidinol dehydrogenase